MEKFKQKLADWGEAVLFLTGLFELRHEALSILRRVDTFVDRKWEDFLVWYCHNVMSRIKNFFLAAALLNTAILGAALWSVYKCCGKLITVLNNKICFSIIVAVVVFGILPLSFLYIRVLKVKPMDWDEYVKKYATLTPDERNRRWGPTKSALLGTSVIALFGSFLLNAACIAYIAMWLGTWRDVDFYRVIPLIFLTFISTMIGIVLWKAFQAVLSGTIMHVGGIFNQIFNAVFGELVVDALPGITDENVKEKVKALSTDFAKPAAEKIKESDVTALFAVALLFSTFAVYPNLMPVAGVALMLIAAYWMDHAQTGRGKMNTLPWIQKSLTTWATVFSVASIWRLLELILLANTGRWISLADVINVGIGWVNALMLVTASGVLIFIIAFFILGGSSDAKETNKGAKFVKYAAAVTILAVCVGWIGRLADHPVQIPMIGHDADHASASSQTQTAPSPVPQGNMVSQIRQWAAAAPPVVTATPAYAPVAASVAAASTSRRRHHHSHSSVRTETGEVYGMTPEFAAIARRDGLIP